MLRGILAVVAGYLVMGLLVFTLLTGAYLGLGADRAFERGSYNVSMLWICIWFLVGLAAALAGGWVCRTIARGTRPPWILAGLIVVLGLVSAGLEQSGPKPADADLVRVDAPANLDAMMKARPPIWVSLANPIVGFMGVVLGARLLTSSGRGKLDERPFNPEEPTLAASEPVRAVPENPPS